ncbi:MAG TPA: M15 family metallopeptidase [Mycobacterium sp.]|nr:M15 family metallopeptidase [Mycobacterium sp.]HNM83844.1 M15 family metallopeptidase [Mycobacterium sp.]
MRLPYAAALAVLCAVGLAPGAHSDPVPPVSADAAAVGFVDVRTVVPDAVIDLRYATPNNFVGTPLYPSGARCLIHQSLAAGLTTAAEVLRGQGLRLVFWDCYRPHSVQVRMFEVVPDPNWVAQPGSYSKSHESGRSVDVTVVDATGRLLDMGTDFDDFTARANAMRTDGLTAAQQRNRSLLRQAMAAGGLQVYSGEWWHFDGPGAGERRPIIDVPVI